MQAAPLYLHCDLMKYMIRAGKKSGTRNVTSFPRRFCSCVYSRKENNVFFIGLHTFHPDR